MTDKEREIGVDFRWFGITSTVRVRDLWAGTDLGKKTGRFAATLPPHGSGLFRLT
jgi:hypothetical protein